MNSLAAHVEYLLRKHDCVVLPGIGALLCNYVAAHFSSCGDGTVIVPPGRALAFNGLISDSDGLLASSVARREGIPYEAAAAQVRDGMAMLRRQIDDCGEIQFGRLGVFTKGDEGQIGFQAMALPSVNGAFYGLSPLMVTPVEQLDAHQAVDMADDAVGGDGAVRMLEAPAAGKRWSAYVSGIAAALALMVTCVLFFMSPIKTDRNTLTASIAPVTVFEDERTEVAEPVVKELAEMPVDAETAAEPAGSAVAFVTEPVMTQASAGVRSEDVEPSEVSTRLNNDDPYCVIVASFPTMQQARDYIGGHRSTTLEILEKDGRFRVYAATGKSYAAANALKNSIGQPDAWVCHR